MLTKIAPAMMIVLAAWAHAQSPVSPRSDPMASQWFDQVPQGPRLRCSIEPIRPFLDFSFRFGAGYVARCPLRQFGGRQGTLAAFVRITPAGRAPVLLGGRFEVPGMPATMAARNSPRKLDAYISFSGGFNEGEGRYQVSVLVRDNRNRFCTKTWKIHASLTRYEKAVPLAILPGEVRPVVIDPWEAPRPNRSGSRLTILLDAEPIRENTPELQAWDRALLLESLSSLLRQISCRSVRVVAFNLDQARQIFEQDQFDQLGFSRLAEALSKLNLGTVSYQALERQTWERFLVRLVDQETEAEVRPNAVVILGPRTRLRARIPPEMLETPVDHGARLFYFEYFPNWHRGAEFPDAIAYLTKARGGAIFKIHSPGDLARAIGKLAENLSHVGPDRSEN